MRIPDEWSPYITFGNMDRIRLIVPYFNKGNLMNHNIPSDFFIAKERIYNSIPFQGSDPIPYEDNAEYGACTFILNDHSIHFRIAKITPTKIGQFVTLWKRVDNNPIQPFDFNDPFEFFIISVRKDHQIGQFIFSKDLLVTKGVISKNNKNGKRAIRVYPPWDQTQNPQATRTQKWQLDYFINLSSSHEIDSLKIKKLLSKT